MVTLKHIKYPNIPRIFTSSGTGVVVIVVLDVIVVILDKTSTTVVFSVNTFVTLLVTSVTGEPVVVVVGETVVVHWSGLAKRSYWLSCRSHIAGMVEARYIRKHGVHLYQQNSRYSCLNNEQVSLMRPIYIEKCISY